VAATATTRRELLRPGAADTARLQRLMSVEQLMLYAYDQIVGSSILPPSARRAMAQIQGHEQAHVGALGARLRARGARRSPAPPSVATADRYLARRHVRERLGQLQGPDDALIMASDAQHEAIVSELLNPGDIASAVPYGLVQGVQ
jgi:hypothetical protein